MSNSIDSLFNYHRRFKGYFIHPSKNGFSVRFYTDFSRSFFGVGYSYMSFRFDSQTIEQEAFFIHECHARAFALRVMNFNNKEEVIL